MTVNVDDSKAVLIGTGVEHCDTSFDKTSCSEGADDRKKSVTVNVDDSKDERTGTGSENLTLHLIKPLAPRVRMTEKSL